MIITARESRDLVWMQRAIDEATAAGRTGEVPVGSVIVRGTAEVAAAGNGMIASQSATAHAELRVIQAASASLGSARLTGCTLYVTLEPCAMCAGAMVLARLDRVVFGAWDDKAGMAGSVGDLLRHPLLNHQPEVEGGVLADECGALLSAFFEARRG